MLWLFKMLATVFHINKQKVQRRTCLLNFGAVGHIRKKTPFQAVSGSQ